MASLWAYIVLALIAGFILSKSHQGKEE